MSCAYLKSCNFYTDNLVSMPVVAELMKRRFCEDDYSQCARYQIRVKLGADNVPADLFPNHMEEAEKLLKEHNRFDD